MALHIHTRDRFNNHTARSLYRIMVMATSVVSVTKIGNILSRAGLEPTSLAFQANVLPLHHTGSLMSPLYPRPPVYVALCFRVQCILLYIPFHLFCHTRILIRIPCLYGILASGCSGTEIYFLKIIG